MARAERLHQRERIKAQRAKYQGDKVQPDSPRKLGILVNTAQPCSCHRCGNPRKHKGQKSFQERRSDGAMMEVL